METRIFAATKAFIVQDGKVLILRESSKYDDGTNSSRYDVVGGRVVPGERFSDGLIREIDEETGLEVDVGKPFFVNEWRPVVRDEQWQIVATFFICHTKTDNVKLSIDHDDYKWINPNDYKNYNIIDNLVPAFEAYLREIK